MWGRTMIPLCFKTSPGPGEVPGPGAVNICPACGGEMFIREHIVYGADADGNRGVLVPVWECPECGYEVADLP